MPFSRPTLPDLIDRAANDIESRLPGTDARLRRSNLNVLARVHAGAVHGLYGLLDFLARQIVPDSAESEYLERWASVWGVQRNPVVAASGSITFTGTNGSVVPAGTVLTRADGAEFETDEEATIAGGTDTVAASAVVPGSAGNTDAGTQLVLASPIAGVNGNPTVAAGGLVSGTDTETDTRLRARLLDRIRKPPQGGAEGDYVKWAKEVSGVTRAWEYPGELGAGTITVRFVRDDDAAAIIPDAGEVAAVDAYLRGPGRRPVTAILTTVAPIADALDFTFTTITPNTAAVKAAVEAELEDLLRREAEPGGTILLSHIRQAVSAAAGEDNYVMTVPAADVAHATGHIATLGVVTWP